MKVSRQRRTTRSTPKTDGRFRSGALHPRHVAEELLMEQLAVFPLGTMHLTGAVEKRGRSRRYVEALCSECEEVRWLLVDNVKSGKTTNCVCQRAIKHRGSRYSRNADPVAITLSGRYDAVLQRCTNPRNQQYQDYGARGIRCLFSREEFIAYCRRLVPSGDFSGLELDRIDNEGHYAPGNVRFVTKAVNLRNKRTSNRIECFGRVINICDMQAAMRKQDPAYRFSHGYTQRLYREKGLTPEEILAKGTPTSTT